MKLKRILMIVLSIMLVMGAVGGCLALSSAGDGGTSSGGSSSASGSVGGSGNLGGSSGSGGGTSVHTHSFTIVIESENCTEGGTVTKTCKTCGYTETSESAPTQHILVKVAEKAATCTEEGLEAYEYCQKCEYSTEAEAGVIPVIEHDMVAQEDKAPTCTETGYTNYSICSMCGKESEKTLVPVIEHDMVAGIDIEPTCTEVGYTGAAVCSMCGMVSEGTEVPALGHDEVTHEDKAATCTETGYTGYITCSRCDYSTMTETPLAAHTYENGTCSVCGAEESQYTLSGTWIFNDSVQSWLTNTGSLTSYVNFVSCGKSFRSISRVNPGRSGSGESEPPYLRFDGDYGVNVAYGDSYAASYYTIWQDLSYRIIELEGEQKVDEDFYNWFVTNAQKIDQETLYFHSITTDGGDKDLFIVSTYSKEITTSSEVLGLITGSINNGVPPVYAFMIDYNDEPYGDIVYKGGLLYVDEIDCTNTILQHHPSSDYVSKAITFIVDDTTYYGAWGMTWDDWVEIIGWCFGY